MLNILVALKCEGRPLRQHFALQRVPGSSPFPLYRGGDLQLVVCGVGGQAATRAVEYLVDLAGIASRGWLNVGVAGHASAPVGAALVAHTVVNVASGARWEIPALSLPGCPTTRVHTVAQPESRYADDCAYDMEAAGFVEAARRVSPPALVQCLKVVSDNPSDPVSRHGHESAPKAPLEESRAKASATALVLALDARTVAALIERHLDTIDTLLGRLRTCHDTGGLQDRR